MNRDERMNFQHSSAPRSNPELRLHPAYTLAVKQTSPSANKPVLRDTGYNAATHCAVRNSAQAGRSKTFSRLAHAALKGIETRIYTQVY
jgi:hypothetical protein